MPKYFTKLDLKLGYHEVKEKEEDTWKNSLMMRQGIYELLVTPFGLCRCTSYIYAFLKWCIMFPSKFICNILLKWYIFLGSYVGVTYLTYQVGVRYVGNT